MDQYVYLFSNFNALKFFGKPNKIGQFQNQLCGVLPIDDRWRVALSEIIYTKSWYNVQNEVKLKLFDEFSQEIELNDKFKINPGFYDTPQILVDEINKVLKTINIIIPPKIEYNIRENYIYLYPGRTSDDVKIMPDLGEEIENILGIRNRNEHLLEYTLINNKRDIKYEFKNLDVFNEDFLKGFHPVEINAGIHYLCVYCDVVTQSHMGDTKSQLLRIVEIPRRYKFGETVHIRYNDRNYKNIFTEKFQSIEISIRDSSNRPIPFTSGQCTVVLHFRNK